MAPQPENPLGNPEQRGATINAGGFSGNYQA